MREEEIERYKIPLMVTLIGICCFLTIYFHLQGICIGFPHAFYIPIILAALWWGRKGLVVVIFLAVFLVCIHFLTRGMTEIVPDFLRATTFLVVALITATLRERIEEGVKVLHESEEKYRTLFETANDAIFIADIESGELLDANKEAERLTGRARSEIVGMHQSQVHPADKVEEYKEKFAKHVREGQAADIEAEIIKKDGTIVPVLISAAVTDFQGNKIIQGLFHDVTERKQAEKMQLELINDLESANEDLRNFMHAATHDLKTPLRGISSLAEWMATDYADKLDEEGKERLDMMIRRVKRMYGLLDGILYYSNIGHVEGEREVVNLNTVVSEIIAAIAPPENIEIEVVDELPGIYYDKMLIEEVFRNLLSNAVRYMDKPEGKVTVGCTEEDEDEDGYWKFRVADNGPGIDERYHEKIFQFFQTLKPRDELESTGVGLTIVKKIVERHGGIIWVESKVGEGSTFFFTVPKRTEEV